MSATMASPNFETALKLARELDPEDFRVGLIPTQTATDAADAASARHNSVFVLPITWSELLRRVTPEATPVESGTTQVARFGDSVINFSRMEAMCRGIAVPLTRLQFKLIEYFLLNPYRVISRSELLDRVWGFQNYPSTRTVDTFIVRLRHKFERVPSKPIHFHTVHGSGYKFVP